MWTHLLSLGAAFLLFPLVIWIPGTVLGYLTNVLEYRQRTLNTQIAMGLVLSMSFTPITVYLLMRFSGMPGTLVFYGFVWLLAAGLAIRHRRGLGAAMGELFTHHYGLLLLLGGWFVAGAMSEIDIITPHGVIFSLNTIDAVAHVSFTNSLSKTGIPPVNPFLYPGFGLRVLYYYLWYLVCSLIDRLGGELVTPRAAVQAGALYVGLAVASLATVLAEVFSPHLYAKRVRSGVLVALLAVTGLDLLPNLFAYCMKEFFGKGWGSGASIEWWNEQVTAWLGAILMSPHHPAGMVLSMSGALYLGALFAKPERKQKIALLALGGFAFASAAGTSAYTTMAVALGLLLWSVIAATRGWWDWIMKLGLMAVIAILLYLPFALELRAASNLPGSPLAYHIREFSITDLWLPSIVHSLKAHTSFLYLLRLVFLPLNYFLELGFFFVAAWLYWRWRKTLIRPLAPEEILLAALAVGSILLCTFVRSTLGWNDLGWRGFLVAQMVLLLWAAPVAESLIYRSGTTPPPWRFLLWICLLVGIGGTALELYNFRMRGGGDGGPGTLALRDTYMWVDRNTPPDSVLLFNPNSEVELFHCLYGFRQPVSAGLHYTRPYWGYRQRDLERPPGAPSYPDENWQDGEAMFKNVTQEAISVFGSDTPADVLQLCHRYKATVIVVTSNDPVWRNRASWVWRYQPAYETDFTRVFLLPEMESDLKKSGEPTAIGLPAR
jgi:hypothetical protein